VKSEGTSTLQGKGILNETKRDGALANNEVKGGLSHVLAHKHKKGEGGEEERDAKSKQKEEEVKSNLGETP
jgi:hypothetical protein